MSDERVFAKCAWRLVPFMAVLYVVNFIDRVNVGFAALTMNRDLGFSPRVFGFGAGVFFVGYLMFQVPANVVIAKVGARRAVFCILLTWGAISGANAFVKDANTFYALRFFLGVAEAGFFPGMIFYLTLWFPQVYRARFTASFIAAIPVAFIIGGPISGLILEMDGVAGLRGWQWLFLIEALPAVASAFVVLLLFPDGPQGASWLSREEKKAISTRLDAEHSIQNHDLWAALGDARVFALALVNCGIQFGLYGITLWLPLIVQGMGFANRATGFVVAVPYLASMAAVILWGRSSDARGERIWHVVCPMLLAGGGFLGASLAQDYLLSLVALTIAAMGIMAALGTFWTVPSLFLRGTAAAGGIALVNTIGSFGGFFGSTFIGLLREQTGGYAAPMAMLAGASVLAAVIMLALGRSLMLGQVVLQPRPGGTE
jgi:ACS family tartrate transporter-like MFS transporter